MPVEYNDSYIPPPLLIGGHLQTIFPGIIRKVKVNSSSERIRINTTDNDFLDLDLYSNDNNKLVIISHGLEGSSDRPYVLGAAKASLKGGFDVVAWNYRGCSGEMNRQPRFYHSGATDDLDAIVQWVNKEFNYEELVLVGFSLGGNLTLKYLGEDHTIKPGNLNKSIVFSVPLDLRAGSLNINTRSNFIYAKRFLKSLRKKILDKSEAQPGNINTSLLTGIKTIYDFDEKYTAPLHGFKNAEEYYRLCSSINYVHQIKIETRIINAINDPLLPKECLDETSFKDLDYVTLELTKYGGHCGFPEFKDDFYWSEKRLIDFLR